MDPSNDLKTLTVPRLPAPRKLFNRFINENLTVGRREFDPLATVDGMDANKLFREVADDITADVDWTDEPSGPLAEFLDNFRLWRHANFGSTHKALPAASARRLLAGCYDKRMLDGTFEFGIDHDDGSFVIAWTGDEYEPLKYVCYICSFEHCGTAAVLISESEAQIFAEDLGLVDAIDASE